MAAQGIKLADAFIRLGYDIEKQDAINKQQNMLDSLAGELANWGATLTGIWASASAALGYATNAAGKHASQLNRMDMIFGDLNESQSDWMDSYMAATRRGRVATTQLTASFGAFSKGLGFTADNAAYMTRKLVEMSGDFQTFTGINSEESMTRMISAMSGSGEVLDRFGINIKEAALNAKLAEMGLRTISQGASEQEKTIARMLLIEQALKDMGAEGFDKVADTYPKALAIMKMAVDDLVESVGQALLPRVRMLMGVMFNMIKVMETFAKNNPFIVRSIALVTAAIGALGVAFLAISLALKGASIAMTTYYKLLALTRIAAVQSFAAQVAALGPLGIAMAAVAALAAALAGAFMLTAMSATKAGEVMRQSASIFMKAWDVGNLTVALEAIGLAFAAFFQKLQFMFTKFIWDLTDSFFRKMINGFKTSLHLIVIMVGNVINGIIKTIMTLGGPLAKAMEMVMDKLGIEPRIDVDGINRDIADMVETAETGMDAAAVAREAGLNAHQMAQLEKMATEQERLKAILRMQAENQGIDDEGRMQDIIDELKKNSGLGKTVGAPAALNAAEFRSVSGQQQAWTNQQSMLSYMADLVATAKEQVEVGKDTNRAIKGQPVPQGV